MESEGWNIILSVDDLVAECDENLQTWKNSNLMASVPEWATGCPIEAEGWYQNATKIKWMF